MALLELQLWCHVCILVHTCGTQEEPREKRGNGQLKISVVALERSLDQRFMYSDSKAS